ncbi:MAG TPA: hypothetical protein VGP46_13545, partial [Acidimicrobiales bacterium]|nr:hypothetical protein [Acidimicrobiales bacterium]
DSDVRFEVGKTTLMVVALTPRLLVEAWLGLRPLGRSPAMTGSVVVVLPPAGDELVGELDVVVFPLDEGEPELTAKTTPPITTRTTSRPAT